MDQSVESGKETSIAASAAETVTVEAPAAATAEAAPEKARMSFRESFAAIASPFTARPRLSRFTVLALAIALAAAAGSAVGAMAAAAFVKPQPVSDNARTIEVNTLRGVITQLSSEVAALKASVESSSKTANAQIAKVADRVEKAEKAQAEPASRVQKLSELLERIDRRTAAASSSDITGSIGHNSATTGSAAPPKQQDRPAIVTGWVIRDVFDGRAMVENDRLGFYEVVPGADLPGVGRVQTIRRQDGRWVVVTPKGLIVSSR